MQDTTDIAMTDDECRLGFSVQTLTYPQGDYELSGLQPTGSPRLERTVALALDHAARIRRQRHGLGYVLERLEGEVWRVVGEFVSLEDVAAVGLVQRATDSNEEREPAADCD